MILQKLKATRRAYLGGPVTEAVTVPAYFSDAAAGHQGRRHHRGAGRQAHHQRADRGRPRLRRGQRGLRPVPVYDLGGGVRRLADGDGDGVFEVLATNGNKPGRRRLRPAGHRLHGRRVQRTDGIDLARQIWPCSASRKRRKGQDRALGRVADQHQPALHHRRASGPRHLDMTLTRAKFNELTADLVEDRGPGRQALKDSASPPANCTRC